MEEKEMIVSIVGMLIGAAVAVFGLYYLIRERDDGESRRVYGIISGAGGVVLIGMLVKLLLEVL